LKLIALVIFDETNQSKWKGNDDQVDDKTVVGILL